MGFRLAPDELNISDHDGFKRHDTFEAAESGERLANIVGGLHGHSVIVLDGPWGSGKSVFVKQWAGLLRQRGHPVVCFDAFEHDHLQDAFFPLFGHLLRAHTTGGSALAAFRQSLVDKAVPLVAAMPRILADVGLRLSTGGVLALSDVSTAVRSSEATIQTNTETMIRDRLEIIDQQLSCVQAFREAVTEAVSETATDDSIRLPLVFVIDELDRCRPPYALNVLERIKHVFPIDGICFFLVTHLRGLEAMVRREYGLDGDSAKQYLDKFSHLRLSIHNLLREHSNESGPKYLRVLADKLDVPWESDSFHTKTMDNLVRLHSVPLRLQERIMVNYALFQQAMAQDDMTRSALAAALCVMKVVSVDLYDAATLNDLTFDNAGRFLQFKRWKRISDSGLARMRVQWKLSVRDGKEHLTDEDKRWAASHYNFPAFQDILPDLCAQIDQFWQTNPY